MVFLRSIFPLRYFFFKSHAKVKETVDETKLDSVISYLDYVYAWNMTSVPSQPILGYHYASVVYCDIVIHKLISYCMAWLQLHFMLLLFLFIFLYRFSTFFSAKFILRLVLYCVDSPFSHSPNSAHCLPAKIWLSYSFHFLLGITVFPREIEKQILGGKRGYMAKVKKVNKYELLS